MGPHESVRGLGQKCPNKLNSMDFVVTIWHQGTLVVEIQIFANKYYKLVI